MKKIITLILLGTVTLIFSQEKSTQLNESNASQAKQPLSEFESPAEFPGGINAFRTHLSQNIQTSSFDNVSGRLRSDIKFKITAEGKIQNITATGNNVAFNNEMIRVIKLIKTKWQPATSNGKPIDYWFTFPMIMQIH